MEGLLSTGPTPSSSLYFHNKCGFNYKLQNHISDTYFSYDLTSILFHFVQYMSAKKVCEDFNSNLDSAGRQRHSETERQRNRGTRIKGEIQSGWGKTPGPDNIKGLEANSSGWNLCIESYINMYITTVMTDT